MNQPHCTGDQTQQVKESSSDKVAFDLGSEKKEQWENIKGLVAMGQRQGYKKSTWHMAGNDVSTLERRTLDYITESMTLACPPKEI